MELCVCMRVNVYVSEYVEGIVLLAFWIVLQFWQHTAKGALGSIMGKGIRKL